MSHDLHESVPYLYDDTAGDGPFSAWVDPILTDECEMIGWYRTISAYRIMYLLTNVREKG